MKAGILFHSIAAPQPVGYYIRGATPGSLHSAKQFGGKIVPSLRLSRITMYKLRQNSCNNEERLQRICTSLPVRRGTQQRKVGSELFWYYRKESLHFLALLKGRNSARIGRCWMQQEQRPPLPRLRWVTQMQFTWTQPHIIIPDLFFCLRQTSFQ